MPQISVCGFEFHIIKCQQVLIMNSLQRELLKTKMQEIFPTDGQVACKDAIPGGIKRGQTPLFSWS